MLQLLRKDTSGTNEPATDPNDHHMLQDQDQGSINGETATNLPAVTEEQERPPEIVLERSQPGSTREPKQWRQSLDKFDCIDPKAWAEHGVKPIRNVPKEFQAQYREIVTGILGDHAESVRQSDLVGQRRLEKVLILLQILLHSPPDRSGISHGESLHG